MFGCVYTAPTSSALLACPRAAVPDLSPGAALHLDFEMEREDELPMVTLLAAAFSALWDSCRDRRPLTPARLKAVLLTRAHTLSRTWRHRPAGARLRHLAAALPA